MTDLPEIEVKSDYDGFFERLVRLWVERRVAALTPGDQFAHRKIVISSGPWRSYAVQYEKVDDVLYLDFYSALRTGFGSLGDEEVEAIIAML
jgi:hypothetical protein